MSTTNHSVDLDTALAGIDTRFRKPIIKNYRDLKRKFAENRYDAAGVSAGKFCEAVLRCLQFQLTGKYIAFGQNLGDFARLCRDLIEVQNSGKPESIRVIVPRALVYVYTIRGKRGIAHVGGDVEPNGIDSATIVRVCDWIVCELIRVYHQLSLEEAQNIVDALSTRHIPLIWEVAGKKRILATNLSYKEQALLLIYSEIENGVLVDDLLESIEYSNPPAFKRNVLHELHKARQLEFDRENNIVYISPLGIQTVEDSILPKLNMNI